jgi:Transposase DDE domain
LPPIVRTTKRLLGSGCHLSGLGLVSALRLQRQFTNPAGRSVCDVGRNGLAKRDEKCILASPAKAQGHRLQSTQRASHRLAQRVAAGTALARFTLSGHRFDCPLRLPPWPENQAEFGVQCDSGGQSYVLARALGLFATASKLMLKTTLGRFDDAERLLLAELLPHLANDDLLIAWIAACRPCGSLPCCNSADCPFWPASTALNGRWWNSFCAPTRWTCRSPYPPVSANARRQAHAAGMTLTAKTVTLRLIKVVLSTGHLEVLATSLLDAPAYPAPAFAELYHARWNIEEAFQVLKHRLYADQFTGESPESIRHDVHGKIFTANLAEALAREAYDTLPERKTGRYAPNLTYLLNSLKTRLFGWLIQRVPHDQVLELIAL